MNKVAGRYFLIIAATLTGCSLLGLNESSKTSGPPKGFTDEKAVPAEIATEISRINGQSMNRRVYLPPAAVQAPVESRPVRGSATYQFNRNGQPQMPGLVAPSLLRSQDSASTVIEGSEEPEVQDAPVVMTAPRTLKKTRPRDPASWSGTRPYMRGRGRTINYRVRRGDTLMKIAFNHYANVFRWKQIFVDNRGRLPDYNHPAEGTVLVLYGVEYVVIHRNGTPYLIRRNDTLGKIAHRVYGTRSRWRSIWHNNPELIHDPDKIYAGFTLYYVPDTSKELRKPTSKN